MDDNSRTAKLDISKAKNPDLRASMAALQRAADSARRIAMQTNTFFQLHKQANSSEL